jgi:hypothetical protein
MFLPPDGCCAAGHRRLCPRVSSTRQGRAPAASGLRLWPCGVALWQRSGPRSSGQARVGAVERHLRAGKTRTLVALGLRLAQNVLRLGDEFARDDDLVVRREHLVGRGEVAPTTAERIRNYAKQHPESGPDQSRGAHKRDIRRGGEDEQQKSKKQTKPGATGGTGCCCTAVGQFSGDALNRFEVVSDNG